MYPTIDLEFITINSFILFNCMGFFLSLFYARRNLLLNNYDHDFFYSIALIAIFSSLFGAKLYFVIENPDYFKTAFLAKFFSLSGSGWYGGFVVTFLTLSIYIKYTNNNLLKVLDILSLSLPIGIIFGRIACFLAGDGCYGVVSHLPWAMDFPNGIIPVYETVHPAQLYEVLANIFIIYYLLYLNKQKKFDGQVFLQYLIIANIFRFFIEFIRLNPVYSLGLTLPQLVAIFLIIFGIALTSERVRLAISRSK